MEHVPAGRFAVWVVGMQAALRGDGEMDVPCGTCAACCRSSQFVHIAPDETDTLAHLPEALLFPAPGRPKGHVLMGYDERGHCPMLVDDRCTVYAHRPRTCRVYDCRVFAAAGLDAADDGKPEIAERARLWRFDEAEDEAGDDEDRVRRAAVRAAAAHVVRESARAARGPLSATQTAAAAVEIHDRFLPDGHAPVVPDASA